jgi:TRAP-type C4-dicarboxylate transport system permease small subunit
MNAIDFAPSWTARSMGMMPRRGKWFLEVLAEFGLIAVVLLVVLLGAYLIGFPRDYNPAHGVAEMVRDPQYRSDMLRIFRRDWYIALPLAAGAVACVLTIAIVAVRALRRRKDELT